MKDLQRKALLFFSDLVDYRDFTDIRITIGPHLMSSLKDAFCHKDYGHAMEIAADIAELAAVAHCKAQRLAEENDQV